MYIIKPSHQNSWEDVSGHIAEQLQTKSSTSGFKHNCPAATSLFIACGDCHTLIKGVRKILPRCSRMVQGSLVTQNRLRFDFNLHRGLKDDEIAEVELLVNGWVAADTELVTKEMPLAEAKAAGARKSIYPLSACSALRADLAISDRPADSVPPHMQPS